MEEKEALAKLYDITSVITPEEFCMRSNFIEFVNSYFYKKKPFKNNIYKHLDDKAFLDFITRKAMDYKLAFELIYNFYVTGTMHFGSILELDARPDVNLMLLDKCSEFNVTEVSRYNSLGLINAYKEHLLFNGFLSRLSSNENDKLILKYTSMNRKDVTFPKLETFDTILCINPILKRDMLDLYLYAQKYNKNIITGYVTNLYDYDYEYKKYIMGVVVEVLNSLGIEPTAYEKHDACSTTELLIRTRK